MTKYEIIGRWAQARIVENMLSNMDITRREQKRNLDDLAQDIYISLMDKDETLIQSLESNRQYMFYIARMLVNNIRSTTSPYFITYKKRDWEVLPNDQETEEEKE